MATTKLIAVPKGTKISAIPRSEFTVTRAEFEGQIRVQMFARVFDAFGFPNVVSSSSLTVEEARSLGERLLAAADVA